MITCKRCSEPIFTDAYGCSDLEHWKGYAKHLEQKIDLKDEDRDKLDAAEWLLSYEKTKSYTCHGCKRDYEIPTHLNYLTCVCGHRCRLRHLGGMDPGAELIDAASAYFGNERSAQLAWIAEIVAGKHASNYSGDKIRKMFTQEMERWYCDKKGWHRLP